MSRLANTPPTGPIKNFESNAIRVRDLIAAYDALESVPGKPRQLKADVAAATIVMTVAAVDTYFGDRLAADFARRFHELSDEELGKILLSVFQRGGDALEPGAHTALARALQQREPKAEVVRLFEAETDTRTYQEPNIIARDVALFGVRNIWGDASYLWQRKYGKRMDVEKSFREWALRRHDIAHRAGRSRRPERALITRSRPGRQATRDEAKQCIIFFTQMVGLVDYRLNEVLYGRQPRRRESDIAIFDLSPVRARRSFLTPRRKAPRGQVASRSS